MHDESGFANLAVLNVQPRFIVVLPRIESLATSGCCKLMNSLSNSLVKSKIWLLQDPIRWLRPMLVMGVLLISVALPMTGSERLVQLAIALIVGIGATLFLLQMPALGLVLVMLGGIVVPFTGPSGINLAVIGIAGLLGLWVIDMVVYRRKITLVSSRPVRPLLLLVLVAITAFFVGQLPWFLNASPAPLDAQIGGLAIFVLCVGAFLLVAHQINDVRWLQLLVFSFLALAGLHIAGWIIPGVGPLSNPLFPNGTVNNGMFWVWLVAMAFSQAFINRKLHPAWRILLGVLTIATLFVGFFWNRDWKSGYLPPIVTVAAIFGLRYWRVGLVMLITGYIPAGYLFTQAVTSDAYSYGTRMDALKIMLEVIKKNPLTGLGPANYYWYVPLYRIRGYYSIFSSHNQYLDLLAQTGILGLACALWFAGEVGLLGWRLRNRVPVGFAQAYVYGALGGLVGTLAAGALADWFIPFVYNIGFAGFRVSVLPWLFLGGLVSLEQIYAQKVES